MKLPKVKFIEIPIEIEIDVFNYFLFKDKWGWSEKIFKIHPELKESLKLKSKKQRISFIKKYIKKIRRICNKSINVNKKKYKKNWEKIEKDFLIALSELINKEWPQDKGEIKAMMSINIISPRFLDDWSFSIYNNYDNNFSVIKVITHEIVHFLYFEKWKEIYPKMNQKKFNNPNIEWHLSEILAPIILNDKKIKRITGVKPIEYKEYKKIKINNKEVSKFFGDLYKKYQKQNRSFEEFLRESYKIIKKNKELFSF
jgi:hypothetical protein